MMSVSTEDVVVSRLRNAETVMLKNGQYQKQSVDLDKVQDVVKKYGFQLYQQECWEQTTLVSLSPLVSLSIPITNTAE